MSSRLFALIAIAITATLVACTTNSQSGGSSANDSNATSSTDSTHQSGAVFDSANLLSADVRSELAASLRDIEDSSSVQIVVVTIDSLRGREISTVAYELFNEMKLGQRGVNNGVLILFAPNDRAVRIQTGLGLEWQVSDSTGSVIIAEMIERFRGGDYAAGLRAAIARLRPLVTSVPWVVRYRSVAEVDSAGSAAHGEIVALKGKLNEGRDSSTSLTVDGRTVVLRLPSHWHTTRDQPASGQDVTVTGRVASSKPLELEALGMAW